MLIIEFDYCYYVFMLRVGFLHNRFSRSAGGLGCVLKIWMLEVSLVD